MAGNVAHSPAARLVENVEQRTARRPVQNQGVPVVLDGVAADSGQQFHRRLAPPRRGHQLDDPRALHRRVADQLRAGLLQVPRVRAVQRDVDLVEPTAFQQPVPIRAAAFQRAVAAGHVLLIDAGQGAFFPAAPRPDVKTVMPVRVQSAFQQAGEHGMGAGGAAGVSAAQGPARAAEIMGDSRPQQADHGPRVGHAPLGGRDQIRAQSLAAASRRRGQPAQPGDRNLHRPELHHPMRQMHVRENLARTPQQQPIGWLVERVLDRRAELGRARPAENVPQEMLNRRVIARAAQKDRRTDATPETGRSQFFRIG